MDSYLSALEKEASLYRGAVINTIYIGGGTPSRLETAQIERLFSIIKNNFKLKKNIEVTFELNPDDVVPQKVNALKSVGVNRVSLGIQSLNDKYLRFLGRVHDAKKAVEAYRSLKDNEFKNVSVDLMFCFPEQTREELENDLHKIISLKSQHISIYALTIEERSRFFVQKISLPEDTVQAEHFDLVMDSLQDAGFVQYEVSNFAKKGFESVHNQNYWKGGNYIGLGVGSHSHQNGLRYWNVPNIFEYIRLLEDAQSVMEGQEKLSLKQQMMEVVLFGLRTDQGIDLKNISVQFNVPFSEGQDAVLKELIKNKYLLRKGNILKATRKGIKVLDEISGRLI